MSGESAIIGSASPPQLSEDDEQVYKTVAAFAHIVSRAESTIRRLIAEGVIHTKHDGRTVRIPFEAGLAEYDAYLELRNEQYHTSRKSPKPELSPDAPKSYGERLADRVMAMGDFITEDQKRRNALEHSSEVPD